ncbi:MAG: hypothetical protein WC437_03855 [Patescibacteria group bacterium]
MGEQVSKPLWKQLLVPITLVIIFVLLVWGVYRIQRSFQVQPNLDVAIPEISNTQEDSINLTGKTASDATVTINDKKIAVNKDGNFTYLYILNPGENKIIFKAKKDSSEPTTVEKIVVREPKPIVTTSPSSGPSLQNVSNNSGLTTSGPAENIGIIGLAGIIISSGLYFKSLKKAKKIIPSYKLFT